MEWNWGMYLFGYLGALLHITAKLTPDIAKGTITKYKTRIALLGSVSNALCYTILFAAASEKMIAKLSSDSISIDVGYTLAAVFAYAGSSIFGIIMHNLPWTGTPPTKTK